MVKILPGLLLGVAIVDVAGSTFPSRAHPSQVHCPWSR